MHFDVAAVEYDRFMGRYSTLLSAQLADLAGVTAGQHALDVGCGPGALTAELTRRLGPKAVTAVDPSPPFVAAIRARFPGVTAVEAAAEHLPFTDATFDVALAQLVVHFMRDPVAGIAELSRVTRAGGSVAACVWDYAGQTDPLRFFWQAVRDLDGLAVDESGLPGAGEGQLNELFAAAGLRDIQQTELWVRMQHASFDEWWEPFTAGVGPAGKYLTSLDAERREAVRERCLALLPQSSFVIEARAWAARGTAAGH